MASELTELTQEELACIYSAAILADDEVPVTSEKISTILKAANVDVEPIWPMLYARALYGKNVRELMTVVGSSGPAPAGGNVGGDAPAQETQQESVVKESKEEPESDSDSDGDIGLLFD